jgi:hypothetical protein
VTDHFPCADPLGFLADDQIRYVVPGCFAYLPLTFGVPDMYRERWRFTVCIPSTRAPRASNRPIHGPTLKCQFPATGAKPASKDIHDASFQGLKVPPFLPHVSRNRLECLIYSFLEIADQLRFVGVRVQVLELVSVSGWVTSPSRERPFYSSVSSQSDYGNGA